MMVTIYNLKNTKTFVVVPKGDDLNTLDLPEEFHGKTFERLKSIDIKSGEHRILISSDDALAQIEKRGFALVNDANMVEEFAR